MTKYVDDLGGGGGMDDLGRVGVEMERGLDYIVVCYHGLNWTMEL